MPGESKGKEKSSFSQTCCEEATCSGRPRLARQRSPAGCWWGFFRSFFT